MWLLAAFRQTLAGFWRLMVGILLGTSLYVYCFLYEEAIFTWAHDTTRQFVTWAKAQPYVIDYAKWNEILQIDDKLAFALFILFARLVWMVFESSLIALWRSTRRQPA